MNTGCNCLGIAAASRVPVKRYNLIIEELLECEPPPLKGKLDPSLEKQVKKLYEYVDFTPYRAPKVSRRLARRLKKALSKGEGGLAKLIVYTYAYLLERLKPEHALLFAREVLVEPVDRAKDRSLATATSEELQANSVVGSLLQCPKPEMKVLGTHLLIVFTKMQGSGSYMQQLEGFVGSVCVNAAPEAGAGVANGNSTPKGSKGVSPEDIELLRISSLRALQVHVQFTQRNTYPSRHLDTITDTVLDIIVTEATSSSMNAAGFLKKMNVTLSKLQVTAPAEVSMLASFNLESPTRGSTGTVALEVLDTLAHLSKDPSEGKRVLEMLWNYFDVHGCWTVGSSKELCMTVVKQAMQEEQQLYMLYSGLLRHMGSTKLTAPGQTAVVAQASSVCSAMDPSFATPALVLALRELPSHLPSESAAEQSDHAGLRHAILGLPLTLAKRLGNAQQLMELLGGALAHQQGTAGSLDGNGATGLLECVVAAADAVSQKAGQGSGHADGCSGIPELLLRELMGLMLSGSPRSGHLVHRLLTTFLPSVSGKVKDAQVVELLSALYHQLLSPDVTPRLVSSADALLSALNAAAPTPKPLVNTARMTLELQQEAAQVGSSSVRTTPAGACRLLQLVDSSWMRLSSQLQCQPLSEFRLQAGSLPGLVPRNGVLVVEGEDTAGDDAKAALILQTACSKLQPAADQRQLLATYLSRSPVLSSANVPLLNKMALDPFVPVLVDKLTATATASPPQKTQGNSELLKAVSRKISANPGPVDSEAPEDLAAQGVKDFLAAAQQLEAKSRSNIAPPDRAYRKVAGQCSEAGCSVVGVLQFLDDEQGAPPADTADVVKYLLAADNGQHTVLL